MLKTIPAFVSFPGVVQDSIPLQNAIYLGQQGKAVFNAQSEVSVLVAAG